MKSVHFSAAELKLLKYTSAANIQKAGTNPKAKLGRQEGGEEKMEGREGGRALLCAQQNSEALTPGRFQAESSSSGVSSLPLPHMPQENGKFSQDSQHLPAAPGRLRGPAGAGGCTHLAHKGSAHLRREEALAGPGASAGATMGNSCGTGAPNLPTTPGGLLPTSRCPRGSKVALARCGGGWGWGGGLMVAAGAGDRSSPGGRVPGRAAGIHPRGAALASPSPACPLPARPPSRPESLYVNEAQLAVCSAHRPGKGSGRGGGPSGIHITQQQSGSLTSTVVPGAGRVLRGGRARGDTGTHTGARGPSARLHSGDGPPGRPGLAPGDRAPGGSACTARRTSPAGTKPGPPQALTPHSSKVRGRPRVGREERDAPPAKRSSLGPPNRSPGSPGPSHVTARPLQRPQGSSLAAVAPASGALARKAPGRSPGQRRRPPRRRLPAGCAPRAAAQPGGSGASRGGAKLGAGGGGGGGTWHRETPPPHTLRRPPPLSRRPDPGHPPALSPRPGRPCPEAPPKSPRGPRPGRLHPLGGSPAAGGGGAGAGEEGAARGSAAAAAAAAGGGGGRRERESLAQGEGERDAASEQGAGAGSAGGGGGRAREPGGGRTSPMQSSPGAPRSPASGRWRREEEEQAAAAAAGKKKKKKRGKSCHLRGCFSGGGGCSGAAGGGGGGGGSWRRF
ncbi:spidroin-2-like [Odocoileus virginianus]|uniref:Spidroin-2-like n=1 Tax=Odocoileus virginianus TaxID=9874 RepID=A0ABM4GXD7_ODOVR